MMENDLPSGFLSEKKYKKTANRLTVLAFIIWGVSIAISAIFGITGFMNQENIRNEHKAAYEADIRAKLDSEMALEILKSKIDSEKRAIHPDYDIPGVFSPSNIGLDDYLLLSNEMRRIDAKYQAELLGAERLVWKYRGIEMQDVDWRMSFDRRNDNFLVSKIIAPLMFGGMIGLMIIMVAKQREIAGFHMQGTLPVVSESAGKLMKSLDSNWTLDILANTGAKMMGKSIDAQMEYGIPRKTADFVKEQTEAMNESEATFASAEQAGVYAEEIAKGIKKGLR